MVRKVICLLYFYNVVCLKGIGEYVNCCMGMLCYLYFSSVFYGLGYIFDYIVYYELVLMLKEYM